MVINYGILNINYTPLLILSSKIINCTPEQQFFVLALRRISPAPKYNDTPIYNKISGHLGDRKNRHVKQII